MSYSFTVRSATKAEVTEKVADELDKVVAIQPVHSIDVEMAKATVAAFLALLPDDDSRDVVVYAHGAITNSEVYGVQSVGVGVNAYLTPKEA